MNRVRWSLPVILLSLLAAFSLSARAADPSPEPSASSTVSPTATPSESATPSASVTPSDPSSPTASATPSPVSGVPPSGSGGGILQGLTIAPVQHVGDPPLTGTVQITVGLTNWPGAPIPNWIELYYIPMKNSLFVESDRVEITANMPVSNLNAASAPFWTASWNTADLPSNSYSVEAIAYFRTGPEGATSNVMVAATYQIAGSAGTGTGGGGGDPTGPEPICDPVSNTQVLNGVTVAFHYPCGQPAFCSWGGTNYPLNSEICTVGPQLTITKPSAGATLSGTVPLETSTNFDYPTGAVSITYTGGGRTGTLSLGDGSSSLRTRTGSWDTTSLPNGTYTLQANLAASKLLASPSVPSSPIVTVQIANGGGSGGPTGPGTGGDGDCADCAQPAQPPFHVTMVNDSGPFCPDHVFHALALENASYVKFIVADQVGLTAATLTGASDGVDPVSNQFRWKSSGLPATLSDGSYTIKATGASVAGGFGSSLPLAFTVDKSQCSVSPTTPTDPPTDPAPAPSIPPLGGGTDAGTLSGHVFVDPHVTLCSGVIGAIVDGTATQVTFVFTKIDPATQAPVVAARLAGVPQAPDSFHVNWTTSLNAVQQGLADGNYDLNIEMKDVNGSPVLGSPSVSIIIDHTRCENQGDKQAPSIHLTVPQGAVAPYALSGSFSIQAQDLVDANESGIVSLRAELGGQPIPQGADVTVSPAEKGPLLHDFSLAGVSPGDYVLTVSAKDAAGNTGGFTAQVTVNDAPLPPLPAVTLIAPHDGMALCPGAAFLAQASGAVGPIGFNVRSADHSLVAQLHGTPSSTLQTVAYWNFMLDGIPPTAAPKGSYTVEVTGAALDGRPIGSLPIGFTYDPDACHLALDTNPPTVALDQIPSEWNNAPLVSDHVTGHATDNESGVSQMELWDDNTQLEQKQFAPAVRDASYAFSTAGLTTGLHVLRLVAHDAAGNVNAYRAVVSVGHAEQVIHLLGGIPGERPLYASVNPQLADRGSVEFFTFPKSGPPSLHKVAGNAARTADVDSGWPVFRLNANESRPSRNNPYVLFARFTIPSVSPDEPALIIQSPTMDISQSANSVNEPPHRIEITEKPLVLFNRTVMVKARRQADIPDQTDAIATVFSIGPTGAFTSFISAVAPNNSDGSWTFNLDVSAALAAGGNPQVVVSAIRKNADTSEALLEDSQAWNLLPAGTPEAKIHSYEGSGDVTVTLLPAQGSGALAPGRLDPVDPVADKIVVPAVSGRKVEALFRLTEISGQVGLMIAKPSDGNFASVAGVGAADVAGPKLELYYLDGSNWKPVATNNGFAAVGDDGLYAVMSLAEADEGFSFGQLYAFPNPAKRKNPTIHAEAASADRVMIRIYDEAGREVHSAELTGAGWLVNGTPALEYEWNIADVASGLYTVVATAEKQGQRKVTRSCRVAVVR